MTINFLKGQKTHIVIGNIVILLGRTIVIDNRVVAEDKNRVPVLMTGLQ